MHQKSSLEEPPISSYSYMCIALCVGLPASLSLSLSLSLCHASTCSNVEPTQMRLPIATNPLWRIETQTLVSTDRSQPLAGPTAASPRPGSTEATEASPKQDRPKPTMVRLDRNQHQQGPTEANSSQDRSKPALVRIDRRQPWPESTEANPSEDRPMPHLVRIDQSQP
jgi:hypothetical protein